MAAETNIVVIVRGLGARSKSRSTAARIESRNSNMTTQTLKNKTPFQDQALTPPCRIRDFQSVAAVVPFEIIYVELLTGVTNYH